MTRSRFLASLAIAATSSSVFSQGPISVQLHSSGHFQPVAYIQDPLNANTRFAVQNNGINNRVENRRLPFRRRERAMLRFRQMRSLQKFASGHANVHNHFNLERHLVDRETCKTRRSAALAEWQNLMASAPGGQGIAATTRDELRLD